MTLQTSNYDTHDEPPMWWRMSYFRGPVERAPPV